MIKLFILCNMLAACSPVPVALPVTDAGNITTMSDASLAAYKTTCDLKVEYLMSIGNELEARYWAYTRVAIITEQHRRQRRE